MPKTSAIIYQHECYKLSVCSVYVIALSFLEFLLTSKEFKKRSTLSLMCKLANGTHEAQSTGSWINAEDNNRRWKFVKLLWNQEWIDNDTKECSHTLYFVVCSAMDDSVWFFQQIAKTAKTSLAWIHRTKQTMIYWCKINDVTIPYILYSKL